MFINKKYIFIFLTFIGMLSIYSPSSLIDAKSRFLDSNDIQKVHQKIENDAKINKNEFLINDESQILDKSVCFQKGEKLFYEISYGFFDLGEGYSEIMEKEKIIDGKSFYQAEIKGWTNGIMSWFANVQNTWGAIFDKEKYYPIKNYRRIRENSYRLQEIVDFDSVKKEVSSRYRKKEEEEYKFKGVYPFKNDIYPVGLITGFIHLRSVDFEKKVWGDTIRIPSFFEDKMYDLELIYKGKDIIKTDFGKINCYLVIPVLPDNSIFRGNDAVKAWLSADKNRVPIHFQAKLYVGKVKLILSKYEKLKNPFDAIIN